MNEQNNNKAYFQDIELHWTHLSLGYLKTPYGQYGSYCRLIKSNDGRKWLDKNQEETSWPNKKYHFETEQNHETLFD
jgi:hypothetical protein